MSYEEIQNCERTSRKQRKCIWCGETINTGERYRSRAYRFEGDFTSDAMHPECYAAMLTMHVYDLEDGFSAYDFSRGCVCANGQCECKPVEATR